MVEVDKRTIEFLYNFSFVFHLGQIGSRAVNNAGDVVSEKSRIEQAGTAGVLIRQVDIVSDVNSLPHFPESFVDRIRY